MQQFSSFPGSLAGHKLFILFEWNLTTDFTQWIIKLETKSRRIS